LIGRFGQVSCADTKVHKAASNANAPRPRRNKQRTKRLRTTS
jgi:hypothetical protein